MRSSLHRATTVKPVINRAEQDTRFGKRLRSTSLPKAWQSRQAATDLPTVGSLATASAITNGQKFLSVSNASGVSALSTQHFRYHKAGQPVIHGTSSPDYQYIRFTSLTNGTQPSAPYAVTFETDALNLEIMFKQVPGAYRILVDGQVAVVPTVVAQTNNVGYLPLTFTARKMRRITFEGVGLPFGGIIIDPQATPPVKGDVIGPRVIVIGDSYTEGANTTTTSMVAFPVVLGDLLGWDDIWASGAGGTGYLNPSTIGGRVTFRSRLTNDVIQWAPDIVIWAGGHNDVSGYTAAALQAEALACYQQVQAALPNCVQVVIGPMPSGGVTTFTNAGATAWLAARDALKAAAAVVGAYFIDPNEMPLDATGIVTTVSATAGVNGTSVNLPTVIPVGSTIDIDGERRIVTGVSGGGPFAHTIGPTGWSAQHNTGATVKQVGGCLWTGDGTQPKLPPVQATIVATPSTTGGSLAAGTYYCKLTAVDAAGETLPSSEFTFVIASGSTGKVSVAFQTVTGAASYNLYVGTSSGGENVKVSNAGTPIVYTGSGGTTATPPASNTSGIRNNGNSDLVVSNDATHPTVDGQIMIARWLAAFLKRYVFPPL